MSASVSFVPNRRACERFCCLLCCGDTLQVESSIFLLVMLHTMLVSVYAIEVQSQDIIIRPLTTSPFKSMYFQIFWRNYCRKTIEATTVKTVPNERKLIYAIYNFIVAYWCLLFSHCSHLNTTTNLIGIFGNFNFSVNGNCEILKCMFTLNGTYLRTIIINNFNILLIIAILYLTSISVNLFKKCTH